MFVYAVGEAHPYREPCREIVRRAASGALAGEASPDLLQEFLHQRARRTGDRAGAVTLTRSVAKLCRFHELTEADALQALTVFERYERLTARDAGFAALALERGIESILSVDRAFDGVDGLRRVDPADAAAVAALSA